MLEELRKRPYLSLGVCPVIRPTIFVNVELLTSRIFLGLRLLAAI
jgi:hypothetical protein